jgi:hypothetical protein
LLRLVHDLAGLATGIGEDFVDLALGCLEGLFRPVGRSQTIGNFFPPQFQGRG